MELCNVKWTRTWKSGSELKSLEVLDVVVALFAELSFWQHRAP
jgi:hypothetical protein